jgi:phosphatidate cytidylyltransferase
MSKNYSKEPNEKPNYDNLKKAKEDLTEAASGTCFSSEQEDKYRKSKTVNRLTNLLTKFKGTFMPPTQAQEETGKKFGDLFDRTKWTVYMLLGFIGFIWLGNFYCALLVLLVIMAIYAELIDLSQYKDRNNEVKNYYPLAWYFFFLCIYYSYLKILMDKLTYLNANGGGVFILRYHNLICFMGYILGFGIFIKSLTKGYYKYQFRSFAWIHIILFIFGISSSLITANIFNGLVW